MTSSTRTPTPAEPCITEGMPLAWRRRCTTYAIERHGSNDIPRDQLEDIIQTSFETWMAVRCDGQPVQLQAELLDQSSDCDVAQYNQQGGNVNTIVFVDDWEAREYDPSAYAYTTVWHNTRTGDIYDADMEINEGRGPYGVCPEPDGCTSGDMVDLQDVVTHEAGHYFGLAHTPDDAHATMAASAPEGEIEKRTLEADDIAGLCHIYPPGSLPETCDFDPRGGLSLVCGGDDGGGCGCTAPGVAREAVKWWAAVVPLLAGAVVATRFRRRRLSSTPRRS